MSGRRHRRSEHDRPRPRRRTAAVGLVVLLGACGGDLDIHDVQGSGPRSPLVGSVVAVEGVVTAVLEDGAFLQSDDDDWRRATSEALFVADKERVGDASGLARGDRVRVRGEVVERRRDDRELPMTALVPSGTEAVEIVERQASLPRAVDLRSLPSTLEDVLSAWESLEGMLVEIPGGLVVGPTDRYGEAVLLLDEDATVGLPRTPAGGLALVEDAPGGDVPFPFRLVLDDALSPMPALRVGDRLEGPIAGVVDYRFGSYRLLPLASPTPIPAPEPAPAPPPSLAPEDTLSFATFNVENLDLGDEPSHFRRLAAIVVDTLGAPDVVGLQEVQDDSGPLDDGIVSSEGGHRRLLQAIRALGGPPYLFREVRPIDNQDGGAPGGNIRVSLLVRTDRGIAVVDRAGEDPARQPAIAALDETGRPAISPSPGRLGLGDEAFRDARKPLVVQLAVDGEPLFVVVCHFSSKRGDDLPFGSVQPPQRRSEPRRVAQARTVAGLVSDLLRLDPQARIAVLGDLNDFPFSKPLEELEATGLRNALLQLAPEQRYTYVHQGVSQALDHVLLSSSLVESAPPRITVAHVNAEHPASRRVSDHDPIVVHVPRPRASRSTTTARRENASELDATPPPDRPSPQEAP